MNYTKTSPKKHKTSGRVPSNLKQNNVDQGNHDVVVIEIAEASWLKKEMIVGESIDGQVETSGYKDGAPVEIEIFETDPNNPDIHRATIEKTLSGNKATFSWKYPEDIIPKNMGSAKYSVANAYFTVKTPDDRQMSGMIPIYSDLNIKVETEAGKPLENVEFVLDQSNGKISTHKTDSSGMSKLKKLPPRAHKIKFPNSSRIVPEDEFITDLNAYPSYRRIVALGSTIHIFKLIELFVYCSHKVDGKRRAAGNTNTFEVVPDNKGKDAYKDEVMILSRTAKSLQSNGGNLQKKEDEYGMNAFLLKCEQDFKLVTNIISGDFWKGLKEPKEYPISGLPTQLTVKCYRPDIYKLQIKFPAMRKWSGGYKVESEKSQFINELKNRRPKTASHWEYKKEKTGWHIGKCPMPISSEAPLNLIRNDTQINLKFMETVGAVVELGNKISDIISFIQKNVPKVGWYFEWENQLFQGTFVVEWGWKEYKDYRAYYYFGLNIDLKIIEFKMEIGIGVSGFSFKVQVYGSITGGVSVSAKVVRYSPEGEAGIELPFSAEIVGALGARVQVGCFVKLEGSAETGIKIDDGALKFHPDDGISASCMLKWTGIVGKFKVSAGTAKKEGVEEKKKEIDLKNEPKEMDEKVEQAFEHELIGSATLGKWEWSSKHKPEYNPPVMPREDLHKLLLKKLEEGDNIRVKTGKNIVGLYAYIPMNDVAKEIEKRIHLRNDIKKDPKTMEAIVFDIRNTLEDLMKKSGFHHTHMESQQFNNFLDNGKLKEILDGNIDPFQEIINQNP